MLKTSTEVATGLADRARSKRLASNLSQAGLSARSGVSLGSLKLFERTGKISLAGFLKIAMALGCLKEFEGLFPAEADESLFKKEPAPRLRGRRK
jgi:transcriptional regulator with XRE-family HTH domain